MGNPVTANGSNPKLLLLSDDGVSAKLVFERQQRLGIKRHGVDTVFEQFKAGPVDMDDLL